MRWTDRVPVVALLATLACSPAVTRVTFLRDAGAVCRQVSTRFQAIAAPAVDGDLVGYLERSLAASETGATALRAVAVPTELDATFTRLLEAIDDANTGLAEAVRAQRRDDEAALKAASQAIDAAQTRFQVVADELGLLDCVRADAPQP